jgi:hypothetical protein
VYKRQIPAMPLIVSFTAFHVVSAIVSNLHDNIT